MVPAPLQDIEKAFEVGVDVIMGMIDRMAHAGLGRKMDHRRKPVSCKQLGHRRTIRKIDLHES